MCGLASPAPLLPSAQQPRVLSARAEQLALGMHVAKAFRSSWNVAGGAWKRGGRFDSLSPEDRR